MPYKTKSSCTSASNGYNPIIIRFSLIFLIVFSAVGILFFKGCVPSEKPVSRYNCLKKTNIADFPVFHDQLDFAGLKNALEQSLLYFNKKPETKKINFGKDIFTASRVKKSLQSFLLFLQKNPSQDETNRFIRKNYYVYSCVGKNNSHKVLFTGYYEPQFSGSLVKDDEYIYPLYSKPDDLVSINLSLFSDRFAGTPPLKARINKNNHAVPYFSRKEINDIDNFRKKALPIAWLKSPIDRFFLEIQGSGKIMLKQGGFLRAHYITSNGRRYRSIGRYLINKREIAKKDMSMQAIRLWLDKHPKRLRKVLNYNPSFVFFKREKGGPFGCLGVAITPMRSIATDRSFFPKGTLCFIETRVPLKKDRQPPEKWDNYSGFVLNQDTGGAIKGPGRADLFYGDGSYAEFAAGHMNQPGRLYFLILKDKSPLL